MRVLLAVDGSPTSVDATRLVASLPWPTDTQIRVLSVAGPLTELFLAGPGMTLSADAYDAIAAAGRDHASAAAEEAAAALRGHGWTVDTAVDEGVSAPAIRAEAGQFDADLIALGSRGYGTVEGFLLGSVSQAVLDDAPCPVLIARAPAGGQTVVAVDGSPASDAAVALVASWPVFRSRPATVITVAAGPDPPFPRLGPSLQADLDAARERYAAAGHEAAEQVATAASARLREAGISSTTSVVEGHPVEQIVAAAEREGAGLIVIGSRGLKALARIRLGSTARGVVHLAHVSVLVVTTPAS